MGQPKCRSGPNMTALFPVFRIGSETAEDAIEEPWFASDPKVLGATSSGSGRHGPSGKLGTGAPRAVDRPGVVLTL